MLLLSYLHCTDDSIPQDVCSGNHVPRPSPSRRRAYREAAREERRRVGRAAGRVLRDGDGGPAERRRARTNGGLGQANPRQTLRHRTPAWTPIRPFSRREHRQPRTIVGRNRSLPLSFGRGGIGLALAHFTVLCDRARRRAEHTLPAVAEAVGSRARKAVAGGRRSRMMLGMSGVRSGTDGQPLKQCLAGGEFPAGIRG